MLRWLRCRLRWCPGYVISGMHGYGRVVWIGWRCKDCGRVLRYGPSRLG